MLNAYCLQARGRAPALFESESAAKQAVQSWDRVFFPFCATYILKQHEEMAMEQTAIAKRIEQSSKENTELARLIQKGSDETAQLTKDIKTLTEDTIRLTRTIKWLTVTAVAVAIITLIAMIRLDRTHADKGGAGLPNQPATTQKATQ
jgi:septal ring factor EnvC (AmiA/AmiB activator)